VTVPKAFLKPNSGRSERGLKKVCQRTVTHRGT
jgi:hypothetical protein